MIRNHSKALGVAVMAVGAASMASAQGWPFNCDDPSTTQSLWSNTYGAGGVGTATFGAGMSTSGTVLYELCFNPAFTATAAGGIQFFIPGEGSVQTTRDDELALIFGSAYTWDGLFLTPWGARANWTYFATVRQDDGGNPNLVKFGSSGIDTSIVGASDRYARFAGTQDNIRVEIRIDSLSDAARVQWTMTNLGAKTNIGLWFGQFVAPIKNYSWFDVRFINFVNVPGYRPLTVMRRFQRNPNGGNTPKEYPMPSFVDFMVSQANAYEGLKIINDATDATGSFPDQTNVDGLDVGLAGTGSPWLLGPIGGNDAVFPDIFFDDIDFLPTVGYIQKWNPRPVQASDRPVGERQVQIVSYYKTTWGDSSFSRPYSVTGDAPKVIATQNNDPFSFDRSQYTLRVYIDNTRGFSEAEKEIQLDNIQVRLNLPQGLADAGDATRRVITKNIARINPKQMRFVDFQVQSLPTTYGVLQYTVEITPQTTSPKKTISGNIVVASQPYLLIRNAANLVGSPWQYSNGSWAAILGSGADPLVPDIDFQAFTWDATTQQYVLQTGPQRSVGTWILSKKNVGFKQLAGGPQQPQDLSEGAPLVLLKSGWNLISNPYNYPIQLGQIVGVSGSNPQQSFTYQELVDQNAISGSLSYWDEATQTYKFIGQPQDLMMPNTGYWINVLIPQDVTISFPPVFIPFIPAGTGGINGPSRGIGDALWSLNLVATQGSVVDNVNRIGVIKANANAKKSMLYEPPISPVAGAISAGIKKDTNKGFVRLAQLAQNDGQKKPFVMNVLTKKAGNVTITWPEMKQVPTKYGLTLIDTVTGKNVNMRTSSSYTYTATANSMRDLKVVVSAINSGPLVENVTANRTGSGLNDPLKVAYTLNTGAETTVRILQNGALIRSILNKVSEGEGSHSTLWNLLDSKGIRIRSGVYQAEVSVTDGDKTETKVVSFVVR